MKLLGPCHLFRVDGILFLPMKVAPSGTWIRIAHGRLGKQVSGYSACYCKCEDQSKVSHRTRCKARFSGVSL